MMEERITSRKNPLLQQVKKLLSSRKAREEAGIFVADGTKLLQEAVPGDVMESVSPMASPQGALFLCALPGKAAFVPRGGCLLLDGIQDPGNLGTILRTADALDVPVVLLEGCADPYSHKVVRASMGAVLRRDVIRSSWAEAEEACRAAGIRIGVTALSDRASDIRKADLKDMAVVIGSEGQGVRQQILASADAELIIPMNAHCESLNAAVAATIVMWELAR